MLQLCVSQNTPCICCGAHRIAVRDDMNDEHIALNFKNFDLAMEILMHTVMAHATGKHSPAV